MHITTVCLAYFGCLASVRAAEPACAFNVVVSSGTGNVLNTQTTVCSSLDSTVCLTGRGMLANSGCTVTGAAEAASALCNTAQGSSLLFNLNTAGFECQ